MKAFMKKHKVITCMVLFLMIFVIAVGGFVISKLQKLDYHDGTVATESAELTEDVSQEISETGEEQELSEEVVDWQEAANVEGEELSENEEETTLLSEDEIASLEETEVVLADAEWTFDEDVFNILLLGTDERTGGFSTNARADSIMILSLNKRDNTMKLVSLQRGMGFPVLEGQYAGQYDWLTHLFRYGGADLMLKSVREVLHVDVDYYVRVNFNTFAQLVDSVGGVDVELTAAEVAGLNGEVKTNARVKNKVHEGMNHLDGYDALQYSRLRYTDSDWKRVQRQRNVIQSVVASAKDMNLLELNKMLDEVLPLVQTNLKTTDILGMISYAPAVLGQEFDQMTIPVSGTYGSMRGMGGRVLYAVDFQKNSEILHEFLYGAE